MHYELTTDMLRPFWPKASEAVLAGTVAAWPDVAETFGINTLFRAAHFWGQITWECGGGTELRENGHYSAAGIVRVFGVGHHSAAVTAAEADDLAAKCKIDAGRALFNRVYGLGNPKMAAELGNTGPDDGWLFRGFDALNSTGRAAARWIGEEIGVDLEDDPDKVNDPAISLLAGACEYVKLGCLKWADADDTHTETVHINGGTNGLAGRVELINRFKLLFGSKAQVSAPLRPARQVIAAPVVSAPLALDTSSPTAKSQLALPAIAAATAAGVVLPHGARPSLAEFFMSPVNIAIVFVAIAVLFALIADRVIRYKTTAGANLMSAFENDAYVALAYGAMKVGLVLMAGEAWLEAYMPLFSDSSFLHVVSHIWPAQQVNAVIEGFGVALRAITIFKSTPLPTIKLLPVVPVAPAPSGS